MATEPGILPEILPEILYEDQHLVVIDKPAGLLSQGEITGDVNIVDWLRARLGRNYVGLVHRLDRNTSGAMVIAKRSKSAERLTRELQDGKLARTYLAWVHGNVAKTARWEHHLRKDEARNLTRAVARGTPGAKIAALHAKPIRHARWQGHEITLVEFELETGRSHQIRAQSAAEGHPLVGDRKYGAPESGMERPALHSHRISFEHPMSHERMTLEAPIPEDFRKLSASEG